MAEKSSEEYPSDNTDNTSETTKPSNNIADQNAEDIPAPICTILSSPEKVSDIFYSFDDEDSEVDAFFDPIGDDKYKIHDNDNDDDNVNVKVNDNENDNDDDNENDNDDDNENDNDNDDDNVNVKVNVNENENDNDNDNVNVNANANENDQNDLVDINIDINNEPNVYAADGDIHHNKLVKFRTRENIEDTMCRSNFLFNYKNHPELFFSIENINFPTPELPLSRTLTPHFSFDVDSIIQGQQYIDFMSVFTEFDFCKPFLEKIFSYLSYKDIASMTNVSKTWRKAVSKSTNAQKELEKVFIHAILYFCHKNANVTDEYKQLYDKMLIHFKNQIQFKKNDF